MIAKRNRRILDALHQGEGLRTRALERLSDINQSQLIVHGVIAREMKASESNAEQSALYDALSDAIDAHETLIRT